MHLVQPIVASVVEGSTHHGHCNRRVRPTSDRKRKFGVNKLFTAVNRDIYDGPMMAECEAYITCVVLASIGPHLRLICVTTIDSNRFIPEIRGI